MDALVWHDVPRDGIQNMAIDEAMAIFAGQNDCLILRVYYWERPFLSLGYFQAADDRLADPLLRELPYTRRLSGGGAIIHDREITYALAVPDQTRSKSPANFIYSQVHAAISECMRTFGFQVHTAGELGATSESDKDTGAEPFLCFQRRTDADLIVDGYKIVGSAQRRISGALLQHGSVLLAASDHAPQLLGLNELGVQLSKKYQSVEDAANEFTADLIRRIQSILSLSVPVNSWNASNHQQDHSVSIILSDSLKLASEKYDSMSWRHRR